jgi:hypothetical protein
MTVPRHGDDSAAGDPQGPPTFGHRSFLCPHCGVSAQQHWQEWTSENYNRASSTRGAAKARCEVCGQWSWWLTELDPPRMVWPPARPGERPHPDMPEAALKLYQEARDVATASPRAAVALLRVALDVLLREVVPDAGDRPLNQVIGLAVQRGLSPTVRVALDVLRAHGNDALHPVQLVVDEHDASEKVTALCKHLNLVVEQMVSTPRAAAAALQALPLSVREQIAKRDGSLPDFPG